MKELNEKINTLQEENTKLQEDNSKLNERLNNCAKQFKKMMQTMNELQLENKKMVQRISELEAKQNNTSINVDCTIPHAKEEKPTVAQQMPSTAIVKDEVTPKEDVDVNEVMKDFANAVKQYEEEKKEHCNEDVLNEFKTYTFQYLDEKKVDNSKRKKVEERINNFINYYKGKNVLSHSIASINQQPSTTVEEERKDCAEKKEDALKTISNPTASDNDSTLTTTKEEEEKPTDSSEMPSTTIATDNITPKEEEKATESKEIQKLRYLDTDKNKQYATEEEAQKDGANPWYLYDTKVGRCITEYTSPSSPSNVDDGIVAHAKEEKSVDCSEMPSTAIVEDDANPKKEEKAKKHMYFKEVTTLTDEILNELKKNYSTSECLKLFKIDLVNHTIVSKTSRDILGYGEESREVRYRIAMDSKEGKRLMKMVAIGV